MSKLFCVTACLSYVFLSNSVLEIGARLVADPLVQEPTFDLCAPTYWWGKDCVV